MEQAMTKSQTITAALAALALAASLTATNGQARAHPKFGKGLRIGLAVGTAIGCRSRLAPLRRAGLCRRRVLLH
jgi:hypothetical protein